MRPSSRRGSVLILALWTLSLLAVFCLSVGFAARQKAAMLGRIEDSDRYFTIAYSGVQKMAAVLIPDENNLWETTQGLWYNNPHDFKNAEVGDGYFSFDTPVYDENTHKTKGVAGAVDEESKININTADPAVIVKLLEDGLDIGSDTAQTIGYGIADWRDSDSFYNHPNYGAEDQDYKDLSKPYEAKDAPFEVLDELLLVKGINREIFDRIKPFVTVYGTGEVNINTASRPVLTALGLSDVLIDKIMRFRAGEDRDLGTADDNIFKDPAQIVEQMEPVSAIDGIESQALKALADQKKLGIGAQYFRMEVKAAVEGKPGEMRLEAVMNHKGKVVYLRNMAVNG